MRNHRLIAVLLLAIVAAAPAAPVRSASGDHAVALVVADEESALALARRLGRPVEVAGLTSETTLVQANPTGTLTASVTREPVRVRKGGSWVPVDTRLSTRDTDGAVVPVASPMELVFSGGGTGPLARIGRDGKALSLTWPGRLPRPVLDGNTATYPEVLPGIDLVVTADTTSFSEVLVVKNAAAARHPALARVRFAVSTAGLRVEAREGAIRAVDEHGEAVISAAPPRMWDSSGRDAPVGVELSGQDLGLVPDRGLLDDPATVYPVYIDPTFGAAKMHWTLLWSLSSTPQWDHADTTQGYARVGYETETNGKSRSVFMMNTSPVNGKHILRATFRILEKWAYNCTARPVELWETLSINDRSTWANQPAGMWVAKVAETSAAKGYEPGGCSDGNVEFNATAVVAKAAAANLPHLTLGLRTVETSFAYWKRFGTNPLLVIEYNTVPAAPANLNTVPASGCVTGTSRPYLSSTTPQLRADLADADGALGQQVTAHFEYWVPGGSQLGALTHGPRAVPNTFSASVPAGALQDNGTYAWRVRAYDGVDYGPWSAWCEFTVDVTPPSAAPAVASAEYPEETWAGGVGRPGTFTFGPAGTADIVSYVYGLNVDPPTTSVPAGASVTLTPSAGGTNTLRVYGVDRAGNRSPTRSYVFYVNF